MCIRDRDYLKHLKDEGLEVDWVSTLADANATRLSKYNVLVILQTGCPDPCTGVGLTEAMVTDFVAMGGGVLLLPQLSLYNLTKQFGAALPAELMNESNASNVGSLSHMVRSLSRFDRP